MIKDTPDRKPIGIWSAVAIGVGGMIGAGIFSILGIATTITGNLIYISFLIGGAIALLSTYSYAKLGTKFPSAGGPVEFLLRGFGDGILSGGFTFLLWIGYIFALSVYAEAFGSYAATFLPDHSQLSVTILAALIILIFTSINFLGPKIVGRSEIVIVGIKVGILISFSVVGLFFIKPSLLIISHFPPVTDLLTASALLFLGYQGFGLITNTAEDIKNPEKNIARALYIAVVLVIIIYVVVSIMVVGNLTIPEIANTADYALAAAAEPFAGAIGFTIMAIAAIISTSSAINATLYGGANISYLMAKKGELPIFFNRTTWRDGKEGLIITSVLVILFIIFFNLSSVALMGSALFLIIYTGVNFAHLKVHKETNANKNIIWLAILGCLFALTVLIYYQIYNSPLNIELLVSVVAAAFSIEFIYRKYTKRALKKRNIISDQ
jgi:amino acid transporter